MTGRGLLGLAVAVATLGSGSNAWGYEVCVDDGLQLTDVQSCVPGSPPGLNCEETFATIPEALAAIAAEEVSNPGGTNWICMIHQTIIQLDSTVVVDNSAEQYGVELNFGFLNERSDGAPATSLCPPEDGSTAFAVDGHVNIHNLASRRHEPGCTSGARGTWVEAGPLADIQVWYSVLDAGDGDAPVFQLDGGSLYVAHSRVADGEAPAFAGQGTLTLFQSDLSLLAPPPGESVIDLDGTLNLHASGLAGNYARAAPLVDVDGTLTVDRSMIVGNVVGGLQAMIRVVMPSSTEPNKSSVYATEVARNRLLIDTPVATTPPDARGSLPCVFGAGVCTPCGAGAGASYDTPQFQVTTGGTEGLSPWLLVEMNQDLRLSTFDLMKNFFVDNEGGAVLVVIGNPALLSVSFVHNTVANGDRPLLEVDGSSALGHLVSARNLVAGEVTAWATQTPQHAESVLDVFEHPSPSWAELFDGGMVGPVAPPWSGVVSSPFVTETADTCAAVAALCPNITEQECFDGSSGFETVCVADAAADRFPSPELLANYSVEWPWGPHLLDPSLPAGHPANAPGATGHACLVPLFPVDRGQDSSGGFSGDGDGYSTLIDCDNEVADATLAPPALDGYDTVDCESVDCWECPDEPSPWAQDDDDSGDDDENVDDDDDNVDDDDDDDGTYTVFESCEAKGCATPFGAALLVPLGGLASRRRRRSAAGDRP